MIPVCHTGMPYWYPYIFFQEKKVLLPDTTTTTINFVIDILCSLTFFSKKKKSTTTWYYYFDKLCHRHLFFDTFFVLCDVFDTFFILCDITKNVLMARHHYVTKGYGITERQRDRQRESQRERERDTLTRKKGLADPYLRCASVAWCK